ncbi:unnamed protein product [Cuscuta europaea]|nr:unnamed protein product [Cuscuta europaea]
MDLKNFAGFMKKSTKEPKKKDAGVQKPLDALPKKGGEPSATAPADVAAKRKPVGKGPVPEGKKPRRGDAEKKTPLVVVVGEDSASGLHVVAETTASGLPSAQRGEGGLPREDIPSSLLKGTMDPIEFLRGATPSFDRATLGRLEDEALESKILRSSLTTCIALGEQARKLEEWHLQKALDAEKVKKLIHDNHDAVRRMAQLEEDLRQVREEAERARKEKAEAAKVAAEAAQKAADEAEAEKAEAVVKAREDAVAAFHAEGWKAEGEEEWVDSVVAASVDALVKGPGIEWMAQKGKSYYECGEYFTQALVYRRLARHFQVDPEKFDPATYGLPLCNQTFVFPSPRAKRGRFYKTQS